MDICVFGIVRCVFYGLARNKKIKEEKNESLS